MDGPLSGGPSGGMPNPGAAGPWRVLTRLGDVHDTRRARTLPFKLYLALAAGRAVVTQQDFSLPEGVPTPPFLTPRADPAEIASRLLALSADPDACRAAALAGRSYYQQWLGARGVLKAWAHLLDGFSGGGGAPRALIGTSESSR